ncbi:MAG: histidine phosphatase family protein [Lachnospiraceae bacterium]|nr:histidine phosphatase family protein [Lachnospiraceae bacterium]
MLLYLIRHGKTPGNEEKRYVGRTDEPLSETGRAELTKKQYPEVDLLFASPMKRCVESAEVLYPGMEPVLIEGFREIDFGAFEGKNYQELSGNPDYQAWIDSGGTLAFPQGESRTDFVRRSVAAFENMMQKAGEHAKGGGEEPLRIAVVSHGGTIMSVLSSLYAGDYFDYQIPNGEAYLVTMTLAEEGWKILSAERF